MFHPKTQNPWPVQPISSEGARNCKRGRLPYPSAARSISLREIHQRAREPELTK